MEESSSNEEENEEGEQLKEGKSIHQDTKVTGHPLTHTNVCSPSYRIVKKSGITSFSKPPPVPPKLKFKSKTPTLLHNDGEAEASGDDSRPIFDPEISCDPSLENKIPPLIRLPPPLPQPSLRSNPTHMRSKPILNQNHDPLVAAAFQPLRPSPQIGIPSPWPADVDLSKLEERDASGLNRSLSTMMSMGQRINRDHEVQKRKEGLLGSKRILKLHLDGGGGGEASHLLNHTSHSQSHLNSNPPHSFGVQLKKKSPEANGGLNAHFLPGRENGSLVMKGNGDALEKLKEGGGLSSLSKSSRLLPPVLMNSKMTKLSLVRKEPTPKVEMDDKRRKSLLVYQKPGFCENCSEKYEKFDLVRINLSNSFFSIRLNPSLLILHH